MARSTYVYALVTTSMIEPVATFTVKWEMKLYLEGLERTDDPLLGDLRLFRMDDGSSGMIAEMKVDDVLNGK